MGFEKAGDILRDAYKNGYGVPAFNVFNYETISFAVEAAEAAQIPVLIEFYPGYRDFIDFCAIAEITRNAAKKVKTPVGLHLDHCGDFDSIMQALHAGFMSVMYDGSALPIDENIRNTKEVVRSAKALGADVEGELGRVGNAGNIDDFADTSKYTAPEDSLRFYNETGVSSLAIAVGNAHGNYKQAPVIDIERIKTTSKMLGIPLVLHGGSGIPDDQVKAAVRAGIAKMNVATEYFTAYYKAVMGYGAEHANSEMYSCATKTKADIMRFLTYKLELLNRV